MLSQADKEQTEPNLATVDSELSSLPPLPTSPPGKKAPLFWHPRVEVCVGATHTGEMGWCSFEIAYVLSSFIPPLLPCSKHQPYLFIRSAVCFAAVDLRALSGSSFFSELPSKTSCCRRLKVGSPCPILMFYEMICAI